MAIQLVELGADHLSAFSKILDEPIEVIASWTCIRSMMESCAIAAWLFEPAIDAKTRVRRGFALRYEGMQQEQKVGRLMGRPPHELDALEARIAKVESDVHALGFPRVVNKAGKRVGIGERMPGATEIVGKVLDEEVMYRLLSAVAHGHHWAIRQLCYQESAVDDCDIDGTPTKAFRKTVRVDRMALLASCGVRALIHAVWNQCRYFGWDVLKFEEVFEDVADKMRLTDRVRFWRGESPRPQAAGS